MQNTDKPHYYKPGKLHKLNAQLFNMPQFRTVYSEIIYQRRSIRRLSLKNRFSFRFSVLLSYAVLINRNDYSIAS